MRSSPALKSGAADPPETGKVKLASIWVAGAIGVTPASTEMQWAGSLLANAPVMFVLSVIDPDPGTTSTERGSVVTETTVPSG